MTSKTRVAVSAALIRAQLQLNRKITPHLIMTLAGYKSVDNTAYFNRMLRGGYVTPQVAVVLSKLNIQYNDSTQESGG